MNNHKLLLLNAKIDITETVDGEWMVLQNGFQVGGRIDRSGAGNTTFHTWREAYAYAIGLAIQTNKR